MPLLELQCGTKWYIFMNDSVHLVRVFMNDSVHIVREKGCGCVGRDEKEV